MINACIANIRLAAFSSSFAPFGRNPVLLDLPKLLTVKSDLLANCTESVWRHRANLVKACLAFGPGPPLVLFSVFTVLEYTNSRHDLAAARLPRLASTEACLWQDRHACLMSSAS